MLLNTSTSNALPVTTKRAPTTSAIQRSADTVVTKKDYYDKWLQRRYFRTGDNVYLRLQKGDTTPTADALGPKLGQRYAGPFNILRRVGTLAYELQIPPAWRIHLVISVDHLEDAPLDVFGRELLGIPRLRMQDHPADAIVATRLKNRNRQYLIRFKQLSPTYNQ